MKFHPWIKIVQSESNIQANVEEDIQEETKIVVKDSEIVYVHPEDGDEETHQEQLTDDISEVEEMETVETSV